MNLLNNRFSQRQNFGRYSFSWRYCFVKFNKLFTNCFFIFKKNTDFNEKFIESFARNIPLKLVSKFFAFNVSRNKINVSTKSIQKPRKNGKFAVVACKINFIRIYPKTAFSINKSRKISIIKFRRIYFNNIFVNKVFIGFIYKIIFFFDEFKFLNKRIFKIFSSFFIKITQKSCFIFFFNKKWHYFVTKINSFFSLNMKTELRFPFWMFLVPISRAERSSKIINKKTNNFFVCRGNLNAAPILESVITFVEFFSAIKTAISVKIASGISKYKFLFHANQYRVLNYFKSKSNRFGGDDPVELRQTAGYRFAYATRITNDAWIINLRATLA